MKKKQRKNKKKLNTGRDIFMVAIITANGGVSRVFKDRKKDSKKIRKQKHKKSIDREV